MPSHSSHSAAQMSGDTKSGLRAPRHRQPSIAPVSESPRTPPQRFSRTGRRRGAGEHSHSHSVRGAPRAVWRPVLSHCRETGLSPSCTPSARLGTSAGPCDGRFGVSRAPPRAMEPMAPSCLDQSPAQGRIESHCPNFWNVAPACENNKKTEFRALFPPAMCLRLLLTLLSAAIETLSISQWR